MKNLINFALVLSALFSTSAFSQGLPGDYMVQTLNPDGFSYKSSWFHTSKTGVPQLLIYDGTSTNGGAGMRAFGPNIVCSTTVCDVATTVGAIGPSGSAGTDGVSPVMSVGTVMTGSTPSVTMTGPSATPVLNFVLKNGVDGAAGATGATGPAGTPGATAFSALTGIPTTIAGYGITDAYPLTANPSGFLSSISSAQATSALGFTPYNATNPNAYIALPAARAGISLTSTGSSGAATYNSTTGVINVPNYGLAAPQTAIVGVTPKTGSYRLYQSFTVTTAGTAVFQLTADGTSTGTALFPTEVFTDSVQPIVNDATSSYQFAWALTNSNKTLTVTINKLSTANILTGVLGQAAAPVGTIVKVVVEGR